MIEARHLTKTYGTATVVDDVSFGVRRGAVTGLLGRNGAGKTTTLRMLLGLTEPTSGEAHLCGLPYAELPDAHRRIGMTADGVGANPGATGRRELQIWARAMGVEPARVDVVCDIVGLGAERRQPVKKYSTGMRQRLSLAVALLSDPEVLILDEPANGLDPEGIRWLRHTVRSLAADGRTVLISSHQLAEVAQTVDDVVILARSVRYAGPLDELTGTGTASLEERFFDLTDPSPRELTHV